MIEASANRAPNAVRTGVPVVRLAPAKLNLTLAVLGRRPDGYHDLHSVVVPLGLADRLSLAPTSGAHDSLHVDGFDAGPIADNLVLRAIAAARAEMLRRRPALAATAGGGGGAVPLAARLEKCIPVAAGLGGGSSDAAAALGGALEAWGEELESEEVLRIAARLGSDVPLFLAGGGAPILVEGRGERVTPLPAIGGRIVETSAATGGGGHRVGAGSGPGLLLVTPAVALRTVDVFAALDAGVRPAIGARAASEHLAAELQRGLDVDSLLSRAGVLASANDLLAAARTLVPGLAGMQRGLSRLLGRPVGQSGSGPTSWVLYPSIAGAGEAAAAVREALGRGLLPTPGDGPPAVVATTIATTIAAASAMPDPTGRVDEEGTR